ncbi:MAG: hypothetical protein RLZZ347_386 [Candidatus Parcubacteria bacterium]
MHLPTLSFPSGLQLNALQKEHQARIDLSITSISVPLINYRQSYCQLDIRLPLVSESMLANRNLSVKSVLTSSPALESRVDAESFQESSLPQKSARDDTEIQDFSHQ